MIPTRALSIRQPWAWAIIYGGKDIENRTWQAVRHGLDETGRFAVHAAKGMTQDEYKYTARFMQYCGAVCPPAALLERGGIIAAMVRGDKGGIKLTPDMWELAVQMRREPYRSNWQEVRDALVDTFGVEITRHAVYHWKKDIDAGNPYPWPEVAEANKTKAA